MKDKYIPDMIMAVLNKRQAENSNVINSPFTQFNNEYFTGRGATVEECTSVQLSFLREVLEDIFEEEK